MCRVLGPRWRAIRLAVMVGSSRLYESQGRTAGFRIRSSVLSGACWIDRAVFAGVNPTGKRLYDGVTLPACRRGHGSGMRCGLGSM